MASNRPSTVDDFLHEVVLLCEAHGLTIALEMNHREAVGMHVVPYDPATQVSGLRDLPYDSDGTLESDPLEDLHRLIDQVTNRGRTAEALDHNINRAMLTQGKLPIEIWHSANRLLLLAALDLAKEGRRA